MNGSSDTEDPVRTELRALIAAGVGLAERTQALAARFAVSQDLTVRDREPQVRLPAREDLDIYLRDLHAALARHDGRDGTAWSYDDVVVTSARPGDPEPDPGELQQVAAAALDLAERTRTVALLAPGLDFARAIAWLGEFAEDITREEDALLRRQTGRALGCCSVPWGVCPEHGNTLRSRAGRSWCRTPECGRSWTYDRSDTACLETATDEITDTTGATRHMCPQHASDAMRRIPGATRRPLTSPAD